MEPTIRGRTTPNEKRMNTGRCRPSANSFTRRGVKVARNTAYRGLEVTESGVAVTVEGEKGEEDLRASQVELSRLATVQVELVRRVVNAMTRKTGHRTLVPRIEHLFPKRMRNTVLVFMTFGAQLD